MNRVLDGAGIRVKRGPERAFLSRWKRLKYVSIARGKEPEESRERMGVDMTEMKWAWEGAGEGEQVRGMGGGGQI